MNGRMLYRTVGLLLLAAAKAHGAAAQEWLTSFKPHPRCFPVINSAPAPDLSPGTTRLLLRMSRMSDDSMLQHARFLILSLPSADTAAGGSFPGRFDPPWSARIDSLPPGRYIVRSLSIGYHPRTDTILLSAGAMTSAWMFLDAYYSGFRCQPPNYRRPTESSCVAESHEMVEHLRRTAQRFAIPRSDSLSGLAEYRREDVALVRDEAVCRRAAAAYGAPESFPRKVIVLRLGAAGYLVYDPFEPISAGEFSFSAFFDRRWRRLFGLTL